MISVEEWLIERKVDLENNKIQCRASIPSNGTWFGTRIRIGTDKKLIKPDEINLKKNQLLDSKITRIQKYLDECSAGLLFIPKI